MEAYFDEHVREKIFLAMTYEDRLRARLVCRKWDKEICSKFSFKVTLSDASTEFSRLLKLPIYSIRIGSLKSDWKLRQLRYPTILAELIISGPIALTNFEEFLAGHHQLTSLQRLVVHPDQIIDCAEKKISDQEIRKIIRVSRHFGFGIPFPVLESLTLHSASPSPPGLPYPTLSQRIFNLFLLSRFQNLRELIFNKVRSDRAKEETTELKRLFKFLRRHSVTLQSLSIIETELDRKRWNSETGFSFDRLDSISDLLHLDLQVKRLHLAPLPASGLEAPLASLLYQQRNLKHLSCHLHCCPFAFYESILVNNARSLTEVILSNLSCGDGGSKEETLQELDLTPFHLCTFLEVLSLSRVVSERRHHVDSDRRPGRLINIHRLPSTLTSLEICGFEMSSQEISRIKTILTKLRHFELVNVE